MSPPLIKSSVNDARGFSVVELLIVVAMIAVISGFALLQITRSHQHMKRANAAQQFAAHLEKARLDSLRRHPTTSAQMGQVSIINARFYSFAIDSSGDGSLEAPQVISLPTDTDFQFNGPFPRTFYFNWRGRTVDAAGAAINPVITISAPSYPSYGSSQIDLTAAGQPSLEGPPVSSPVINSPTPAPSFRANTQIP